MRMTNSPAYKQDIYEGWAHLLPDTSPQPTNEFIQRRVSEYQSGIIRPWFPTEKSVRILDIGCGYGIFLQACQDLGYAQLFGVDGVQSFIDFGRDRFGLKNLQRDDLTEFLRNSTEPFDVITAIDVLEHQPKAELLPLLRLIHDKLAPGGIFLFQAPNGESLQGANIYHSDITHELAFTRLLSKELLGLAGFKEIHVHPSFVNKNPLVRLGQRCLAYFFGLDSKFMYSSNIRAIGIK